MHIDADHREIPIFPTISTATNTTYPVDCPTGGVVATTLTTTPDDYWRWVLEPGKPITKEEFCEFYRAPDEAIRTTPPKSTIAHAEYTPKRILRHGPATIVFWQDGTKTIVKLSEGEEDNAYAAFTAALAIKIFGSNSKLKKMVKDLMEEKT